MASTKFALLEDGEDEEVSAGTPSDQAIDVVSSAKEIGVFGLVSLGFFWVVGGVYGNEPLIKAAPPGILFLVAIWLPFVYSLPVALITGELATAIPSSGGSAVWVEEAFGVLLGGHNCYWEWINWLLDSAIYPVLLAEYVVIFVRDETGTDLRAYSGFIAMGVVLVVTLIKLLGMQVLVRFSSVLAVLTMIPSLLYIGWGLPRLDFTKLVVVEGDVDWALLSSWLIWCYCGFLGLGALAGEVKNPKRTYPMTTAVLLPMVILNTVLPLAVSVSIDNNPEHYSAGYYSTLAEKLAGPWLRYMFLVGSQVCLIGLYNAQVMAAERSLMVLIEWNFQHFLSQKAKASQLWAWLLEETKSGCGAFYVLLNACVALALVWVPYQLLVQFSALIMSFTSLLFMIAFVWLRYKQPDLDRPYKVPGGHVGAVLCAILPALCTMFNIGAVVSDPEEFMGVSYVKVYSLIAVLVLGIITHFVWHFTEGRRRRRVIEASGGHAINSDSSYRAIGALAAD